MGGVINGQAVDQDVTNAAFLEKNGDDNMPFSLGLTSTKVSDGSSVGSVQQFLNAVSSFLGVALSAAKNAIPAWTSNNRGTSADDVFERVDGIDAAFDPSTGHVHSGAAGDGPPIPLTSIDGGSASTGQVPVFNGSIWAPGSASGGGGGSLQWVEVGNSPESTVLGNYLMYQFDPGLGQQLYTVVKVPTSYGGGTQIKLKVDLISPDTSGTALLQSVATLIRQGTDQYTDTTNQHTSSNSAITLSAGTQSIPQSVILDLTDSSGLINSVAVSAGDLIPLYITRGTDTATNHWWVPVYGAEVTFI